MTSSLRRVALFGAVLTVVGFLLVFLPIFQNPSLWSTPSRAPAPAYALLGLVLFPVGIAVLLYSLFVFMRRNKGLEARRTKSLGVYKMAYKPAIAGAIAFWLAGTATRLILPSPPGLSPSPWFSVGRLFWSIIVGGSVSYYLIWYFDKIPSKNPIIKSVILSSLALIMIDGLVMLFYLSNPLNFFLLFVSYEAATFIVAGVVIGFVHVKLYGSQSPFSGETLGWLEKHPITKRERWYYYLGVTALIALSVISSQYQESLKPASFTASGIHFVTNNGTIEVVASITNPSQPSLIQVNAAVDGLDDGVCGYGIKTNQTMVCNFSIEPLLSCNQLPESQNHTLTLNAYFSNTKTVINMYSITRTQLGCP